MNVDMGALAQLAILAILAFKLFKTEKPKIDTRDAAIKNLELEVENLHDAVLTWKKKHATREAREEQARPENGTPATSKSDLRRNVLLGRLMKT